MANRTGPGNSQLWTTGYGDLTNILFDDEELTGVLQVTLTADVGFAVQLYEFDAESFIGGNPTIDSVSVSDGTTTLFAQSNATISSATHTTFDFTAAPLTAGTIVILNRPRFLGDSIR